MFGNRYFSLRYFADRFFPGRATGGNTFTGDVALSFGVASAFVFVAAAVVVTPPASSGGGVLSPFIKPKPAPIVFEYVGRIPLHQFGVASPVVVTFTLGSACAFPPITPRSSRQFINVPPPFAIEELLLAVAL